MTRQALARELTVAEGGAQQVNIAQMNEVLKVLSKKLQGPQCAQILKALLASLILVLVTGCGMIPADLMAPIDKAIKDHGAGHYYLACQLGKDDKQLLGVKGDMECTAAALQLTGCHPQGITVKGPQ